jgi:hypothetical protein
MQILQAVQHILISSADTQRGQPRRFHMGFIGSTCTALPVQRALQHRVVAQVPEVGARRCFSSVTGESAGHVVGGAGGADRR